MDEQPIANHLCKVYSTALIINLMEIIDDWLLTHVTYKPFLCNVEPIKEQSSCYTLLILKCPVSYGHCEKQPIWKFLVVANNLVLYKVATRLKIPWICNLFYLVATFLNGCKHLVTTLKQLRYLCKDYMASTLQKLMIPIFGYCNLSIPLLKHFIKDPPYAYSRGT